jgi:hypothetical protein
MKKLLLLFLLAAVGLQGWARDLYLVGDATPADWELSWLNTTKMTEVSTDVYEWTGVLFNGTGEGFKILTQTDWNPGIHPSTGGMAIDTAGSDVVALPYNNDPDTKWTVSATAEYKIRVTFRTDDVLVECTKVSDVVVDGFLQVSSADLLLNYSRKIVKGRIGGNAYNIALTQDIDLGSVGNWTPIGTDGTKFTGTFDGSGHRITNMTLDDSKNEQGFFGVIGAGATIKNLIMDASCSIESTGENKGKCLAAFAACCNNNGSITFENCGNEANVTGTKQNNAGFLGCNYGSTTIVFNNCYNKGNISGGWENGAFSGWTGGGATFKNCYNIGEVNNGESGKSWARGSKTCDNCYQTVGDDGDITTISSDLLASGELCYKLNGNQSSIGWYQNLSGDAVDNMPVPFSTHSQVYANGELSCDGSAVEGGTLTYSNTSTSVVPPHSFSGGNGWCTVCHALDQNYLSVDGDGFYSIGTANDLNWLAEIVHKVNWQAKAKLTADIDYTSYKQGFIGKDQGDSFGGIFDGQEHTITIDMVNDGTINRTGLFAYIYDATIKNLVVEGSATSADKNCIGGLGGRSAGTTTIENVIVKTAVSYTGSNGDATAGGILANAEGTLTLKNCAFLGSINTGLSEGNGGLVGYANSGSNNKYYNCLVAPTTYTQNGNSGDFSRNNPYTSNCYKVASNDARLASGELCYMLNGDQSEISWYQNLTGTVDATPVPFSSHSHVYANGSFNCDGTPKGTVVYGNNNDEHHDPHVPDADGFCTSCDAMTSYVAGYMTPAADGYYEISDNKQMRWFAAMIKDYRNVHNLTSNDDCNAPINARLMNDIDFTGIKDYAPIGGLYGQGNTRYNGTFDGQHYKITNLTIDLNQDNVGIFGVIAEGAVIKNFTLDSSCSINGNGHVGIVGEAWRSHNGDVLLECLGNEANITGNGTNVGGILGVNMLNGSYAKLYMTNCYSTGKIKSTSGGQSGQLTGWSGDHAVVTNCYAIGEMENCDGFARLGSGSTVINGYCDKSLDWSGHPTQVTAEQIASGEVCAKLGYAFRQAIGTGHPNFNQSLGFVNQISAAGYSTQYNTYSDVTIPSGIEAFAGVVNGEYLSLTPISSKIKAGEPVILKGTAGLYNFMPTTDAEAAASNSLLGSNGSITGGTNIYALSQQSGEVGFYPVSSSIKIPEGRAYLNIVGAPTVKGYTFVFDDDATAIEMVNGQSSMVNGQPIYNLAGQRISKMQKGINIVNGKKILK